MNNDWDFFRNNICRTCKRTSEQPAKSCTQCRQVSYCSREHQLQDWNNHKALCKIIANEAKYLKYDVTNYEELQKYKQQRGLLWQLKLGRQLTKSETQMFMFPRVCSVCYKRESLFNCPECQSEFYCSKLHLEQHKGTHLKFCQDLKLSLDMECYFYHNEPINVFNIRKVSEQLVSMPRSLKFLSYLVNTHVSPADLNYVHSCDQILSAITILFALDQVGVLVSRKLAEPSLKIHIVGATAFEYSLDWALIIEIFFHWIRNLDEILIVFIGPEMNFKISFCELKTQFCEECRSRTNLEIREAEVYNSLYCEKVGDLEIPDVVVAFNSGIHEFHESKHNPWKDSLESLVQNPQVPLVLTAYTEKEIQQDLQIIKDATSNSKVKVVYGPTRNPFSNCRPLQDWATENTSIYFVNNFLTIVKKDF